MTPATIEDQLARDEGDSLKPYQDNSPLKLWTIGKGHKIGKTLPAIFIDGITPAQDHALFISDLQRIYSLLAVYIPWWASLDGLTGPRSNVLVNMAFNMGVAGLCEFVHFLGYMHDRDWRNAANEMENSTWWCEVGARAFRLRQQIILGMWQ